MHRLEAAPREPSEKNPRELRRRGLIPGVLYGPGLNRLIKVKRSELERLLGRITRSSRITLVLDGEEWETFIKEVQYHPLTDEVLHVDFYWPGEGREVEIDVPVILRGEPKGRKLGGVLRQLRETVKVKALPERIPEKLELDVSELDLGESLRVGDLKLEGLKLLTPAEVPVAAVKTLRVEVAAAEEAAAPAPEEAPAPEAETEAEAAEAKEKERKKEG